MQYNDEICAFIVNGRRICFDCYDPNCDKEEDILSGRLIAESLRCTCHRCKQIIDPGFAEEAQQRGKDFRYQ